MTAAVLAGGENRRFPFPKGFMDIAGRRAIESILKALKGLFDNVVISTNEPELYFYLGVPMIGDIIKERGPMTGILSVLSSTGEDKVFFTACDMPFINPELVKYIIGKKNIKDACIPFFDGFPQPLMGLYARSAINAMEKSIKEGKKSLKRFLEEIDVLYIGEDEIKKIDPEGRSFVNINTVEDYEREAFSGVG